MRTTKDLIAELRAEAANADFVALAVGSPNGTKIVSSLEAEPEAQQQLDALVTQAVNIMKTKTSKSTNLPEHPELCYRMTGEWKGWKDFLGEECPEPEITDRIEDAAFSILKLHPHFAHLYSSDGLVGIWLRLVDDVTKIRTNLIKQTHWNCKAHCSTGRFRQLHPPDRALNVGPLVERVVEAMRLGKACPDLKWLTADTVRINIGHVIPATFQKTTEGRRRRFKQKLEPRLAELGWRKLTGTTPNTYQKQPAGAESSAV